jgi:uncharacterized membrane protein YeaQ/YmgE (transglycosylase-associated protein family)
MTVTKRKAFIKNSFDTSRPSLIVGQDIMGPVLLPFACAGWYAGLTFKGFGFGFGFFRNVAIGIIGAVIIDALFGTEWADFEWVAAFALLAVAGTIGASIAGRLMEGVGGATAFTVVGIIGFFAGIVLMGLIIGQVNSSDYHGHFHTVLLSVFIAGGCILLLVGGFMWSAKGPVKQGRPSHRHPTRHPPH